MPMDEAMTLEEYLEILLKFEGPYSVEEAALTHKQREKLPTSAFCGPNRTYPAHDKKRIRNAMARLGTFGRRLKPAVRRRIFSCIKSRAKKLGIEVSEDVLKKYRKKAEECLQWYLEKREKDEN